jgi:hypothetical protein
LSIRIVLLLLHVIVEWRAILVHDAPLILPLLDSLIVLLFFVDLTPHFIFDLLGRYGINGVRISI